MVASGGGREGDKGDDDDHSDGDNSVTTMAMALHYGALRSLHPDPKP